MSIGRQVSHGVFWVGISTMSTQALVFATSLILMGLLPRSDFGMVAMAYIMINALTLFQDLGFSQALIYRRDRMREAADTMFVLLFAVSIMLYMVAFIGARPIATFFNANVGSIAERNELVLVIRVLSLSLIFAAFGQVPFALLSKEMQFRRRLGPDVIPQIAKTIAAIILALRGFGVWSLVWSQILYAILSSIMAWVVSPLRPRIGFDSRIARELWDYGKHIQGSQVLVFFITNIDYAFVGRLLGSDALGVYGRAFDLSNTPATRITKLASQVMFPALSRMRDSLSDQRRVFLRAVKYTSLLAIPLGVGIFAFAEDFLVTVYDGKWNDAIFPVQCLVIYGVIRSIAGNMGDMFKAGGKPQWLFRIALLRLAAMAIFLYPVTTRWGIDGVSAFSAVIAVFDFILATYLVNRLAATTWRDFAVILVPFLIMAIVSAIAGLGVLQVTLFLSPLIALVLGGLAMIVVYAALVLALDGEVRRRMLGLISEAPAGMRLLRRLGLQPQTAAPSERP